ncbi:MAG: arylsulfatase A-like enzyme [Planctomycetota bacterium]|jgi:arylsulfatase A-like enzyme
MRFPTWSLLLAITLFASCSDNSLIPRPNVLVITIDSLRADRLGCYGYERKTSPNLDKLASEGVLFERAYSHAPFTAPSHASLLTSLHTKTHGVYAWAERLSSEAHNLAERLAPAGYRTGAFYNHPGLRTSQITRGFGEVQERFFEEASKTSSAFLDWVDNSQDEQPFAVWVHYWDVHRPYAFRDWRADYFEGHVEREPGQETVAYGEERFGEAQPPTTVQVGRTEKVYNMNPKRRAERVAKLGAEHAQSDIEFIANRYDGGVWFADQGLGELLEGLRTRGMLDNTLVVVTADHGESLTEREACYFTHDPFLYEETLHVPLVIRLPGAEHAGERITSLTRLIDVIPTIHEVLDLALLGDEQGQSLLPAIAGEKPDLTLLMAQTMTRNAKETGARVAKGKERWLEERTAISDGRFKAIHDIGKKRWELYDLQSDPAEKHDLASLAENAERLTSMRKALRLFDATIPAAGAASAEITGDLQDLLRGIGYIGEAPEEKEDQD